MTTQHPIPWVFGRLFDVAHARKTRTSGASVCYAPVCPIVSTPARRRGRLPRAEQDSTILAQVIDALKRVDHGTFGGCVGCKNTSRAHACRTIQLARELLCGQPASEHSMVADSGLSSAGTARATLVAAFAIAPPVASRGFGMSQSP